MEEARKKRRKNKKNEKRKTSRGKSERNFLLSRLS
jgi:hypothetical protein